MPERHPNPSKYLSPKNSTLISQTPPSLNAASTGCGDFSGGAFCEYGLDGAADVVGRDYGALLAREKFATVTGN